MSLNVPTNAEKRVILIGPNDSIVGMLSKLLLFVRPIIIGNGSTDILLICEFEIEQLRCTFLSII